MSDTPSVARAADVLAACYPGFIAAALVDQFRAATSRSAGAELSGLRALLGRRRHHISRGPPDLVDRIAGRGDSR
jgi:hypothetical protein